MIIEGKEIILYNNSFQFNNINYIQTLAYVATYNKNNPELFPEIMKNL